ncbi:carbohydrate kinase family protein [Saccharomonospora sp. NPDC006951]
MSKTVLFVGDSVYDTTVRVARLPGADEKVVGVEAVDAIGGVATNAAVACARTGNRARLVSVPGTDPAGRACAEQGAELGLEFLPETVPGPANRAVISLAADGEKQLVLVPGARMYPTAGTCRGLDLRDVAWVHTAVYDIEAAAVLSSRCAEAGIPLSIDLEPATFPGGIGDLAPHLAGAAVAFCNSRAAQAITGSGPASAEEVLFGMGVAAVVRTEGSGGASWCTPEGTTTVSNPGDAPPVVDTTGAGDCLAGSFAALSVETGDPLTALRYAVRAASHSCSRLGGHRSFLSREELAWTC